MKIEKNTVVLGVIEFNSIAAGFEALDKMLKTAPIKIIEAETISLGKYLIAFTGDLASVEYSYEKAVETDNNHIIDKLLLSIIHPEIIDAIGNIKQTEQLNTIGIIETLTVTASIEAADAAAKIGGVKIIEIRLAVGFGGKSYVKMSGSLENVQSAMEEGIAKAKQKNQFFAETIIPQPDPEIKKFFLK